MKKILPVFLCFVFLLGGCGLTVEKVDNSATTALLEETTVTDEITETSLSETEENMLSTLSEALSSSSEIYESLTDSDLTFGSIVVDGKKQEFTESNYSTFIESSDRNLRKKAFNILYKTYSKYIHTITNTFRFNIETNSKIAKLKHYNSSIEASLFHDNIDLSVYDNLVKTVNANLDALYDYYDLKKEVLGLNHLHLYDIYASMVKDVSKKYLYHQLRKLKKRKYQIFI